MLIPFTQCSLTHSLSARHAHWRIPYTLTELGYKEWKRYCAQALISNTYDSPTRLSRLCLYYWGRSAQKPAHKLNKRLQKTDDKPLHT